MSAKTWSTKSVVMNLDHIPCLWTARSKHQARNEVVGRCLGRLEGRWRAMSFFRSIHSRCGCVKYAAPVFVLKLAMMML